MEKVNLLEINPLTQERLTMLNKLTEGITVSVKTDGRLTKNGMKRTHPRTINNVTKKFKAMALEDAKKALEEHPDWETLKEASINIVSYYSNVPMDYDGLACSVAPTIDGMVDAGVLEDDSPHCVKEYLMDHIKVDTMAERRVEVTVTPHKNDIVCCKNLSIKDLEHGKTRASS